ncbi:MAG: hypothetical protein WBD20_22100, partial [Pirellulaceae bacterium]
MNNEATIAARAVIRHCERHNDDYGPDEANELLSLLAALRDATGDACPVLVSPQVIEKSGPVFVFELFGGSRLIVNDRTENDQIAEIVKLDLDPKFYIRISDCVADWIELASSPVATVNPLHELQRLAFAKAKLLRNDHDKVHANTVPKPMLKVREKVRDYLRGDHMTLLIQHDAERAKLGTHPSNELVKSW